MTATLFDFDGVLVDSEPVHLAAFNDVLAKFGVTISEQAYADQYLSLDDAGVLREVLSRRAGRAPDEREVRALVMAKEPRFLELFSASFRVFPGAAEVVARRAARGIVGIVSGALAPEIAFALDRMGIGGAVSFIVSAEHTPASKPDPAPYLLALEELRGLGHGGAPSSSRTRWAASHRPRARGCAASASPTATRPTSSPARGQTQSSPTSRR